MIPEEIKKEHKKLKKRETLLRKKLIFLYKRCQHSNKEKVTRCGVDLGDEKCLDCGKVWINFGPGFEGQDLGDFYDPLPITPVKRGLFSKEKISRERAKLAVQIKILFEKWRELVKKCEHPKDKKDWDYNSARDIKCLACGALWSEYGDKIFPWGTFRGI